MNEKIKKLETQIIYHNKKYWIDNDIKISDIEYDTLINKLKVLDPNNALLTKINSNINNLKKIKHTKPMLSLDKAYSFEEIYKWMSKISRTSSERFRIQPKLDGIAGKYKNKILATRGDGIIGEDITNKIPILKIITIFQNDIVYTAFESIKDKIDYPIIGELIIFKNEFIENKNILIRKNTKPYKTPRSAVAGICALDNNFTQYKNIITFIEYNTFNQYEIMIKDFNKQYLNNIKNQIINSIYPCDGLVFKLSDEQYSESLGFTSHHPRGQIALKLKNPSGITKLKNVIFSSGKGELTPVGIIEPIIIDGILNSKINLHNLQYIINNDIAINDMIEIERCGEIIPQYKSTQSKPNDRVEIKIKNCPYCGSPVIIDLPHVYCSNKKCEAMLVNILYDSIIRLEIDGLGKPTIEKLISLGYNDLIKILNLTINDIMKIEGFQKKSSTILYNNIQKVKNNPIKDWQILSCLNIPGIGTSLSKKILKKISFDELLKCSFFDLINMEQIGETRAQLIIDELNENKKLINDLKNIFKIFETKNQSKIKYICFTGKNEHPRKFWIELAKTKGFEFKKSISSELDLLVSSPDNSSNKIKKATKLNIPIITYENFLKR